MSPSGDHHLRGRLARVVDEPGLVPVEDQGRYLVDERGKFRGEAIAVVRPSTVEQVSSVISVCAGEGVAVVPQGGNTGLCGGSVPPEDTEGKDGRLMPSVLLSLSRLNRIRDLNVVNATVEVEAGVTIQAVQEAAAGAGMLFAPDWGARGSAQIGGAVSTNAGGLNVVRWGGFRRQVLGLEVVLADGRIWDGRRSLYKDSTGLDLKQLFVGSEGTLGIVTAAVLRLVPRPDNHVSALATLATREALLPLFADIRARGDGVLSGFELITEDGVARALADVPALHRPGVSPGEWYTLIRYSGDDTVDARLTEALARAVEQGWIVDAAVAVTAGQQANLWHLRDELPSGRRFDERGRRHKFDIALPIDQIVAFVERAERLVDDLVPGTRPYVFGHVGDGNLHFSLYPGPGTDLARFDERGAELVAAVDGLTWELEGSISAEHGIGQEMRQRLSGQKSDVEFELMARVKQALDPEGILNPGKVLPPGWTSRMSGFVGSDRPTDV